MGKMSGAQEQRDVPGNGSREVFQGLFKDLGKQAMALEAILRVVCGRVDKLENWLTEVSFGMTELDLKLRNIAHNIDGTAAVDDEARGPHRWAIPQTEAVKPVASTVSKKLGTEKKAVRVTGMAAAILDRLATTSETGTPTPVETEKVEKPSAKKKNKDKKHNTKKVKANGSTELPPTPLPPVVEISTPVKHEQYEVIPSTPPVPIPAVVVSAPAEIESPPANSEISRSELVPPTAIDEALTMVDIKASSRGEANEVAEVPVEVATTSELSLRERDNAQASELNPSNGQSNALSSENNPGAIELAEKEILIVQNVATTVAPTIVPEPPSPSSPIAVAPEPRPQKQSTPNVTLVQNARDKMPILSPSVSSVLPTVEVEQSIEPFLLKTTAHTVRATPTLPNSRLEPESGVPEHQVMAPQVTPTQPTEIPSPIIAKVDCDSNSTFEIADIPPTITESIPIVVEKKNPGPKSVAVDVKNTEPIAAVSTTPVTAAPSTANEHVTAEFKGFEVSGAPIRQREDKILPQHDTGTPEAVVDPLLPHRSPSRRRSSKMAQRSSSTKKHEGNADNEPARRLSINKRSSHSRRSSISLQAKPVEQETPKPDQRIALESSPVEKAVPQVKFQPVEQAEPKLIPQPQAAAPMTSTTEQENIEEESQESGSDSVSEGSDSSSGEEQDAEAVVEEISNAMTALRKLKRAQMLSPEEETELKERAHKKWFQLKGHIKEKQKKDVTNILLKRKKNVFTVSSRIELLEEKSREIFAALKQIMNELREKNDRSTHETLRRRVADIEQSLLTIDSRFASLSAPAMDNVRDLENEVVSLRSAVQMQLTTAQSEAEARHSLLEEALASQRTLVETLAQDVPAQINVQTELFMEKFKQLPDHTAAIENLRRSLKRKADLKLLKELEARLLGLDAENEDCLVRCLSCRKEVINLYNDKDTEADEQDVGNGQLRKVNPGPSSARIYRSNIPFSAQTVVQESIQEESSEEVLFSPQPLFAMPDPQPYQQFQSAGDSHSSEKAAIPRSAPVLRRDTKIPQASPLSLMNITATRAILSPDRPISAPVVALKKRSTTATRSKSLLKSLTLQPGTAQ
ncbi:hypothetical protein L915_13657 [Phytophthora nicotianae]|uniref:Uncharacterized protein n=1 Tax=Phytophthora nicotianae TaxID=4792 RepID=W2GER9_PHYNI|nr:hypothetical protein L915_13657 [Phytophthora nicotianae]